MRIENYIILSIFVSAFIIINIFYLLKVVNFSKDIHYTNFQRHGYYGFFVGQMLISLRIMSISYIGINSLFGTLPFIYILIFGVLLPAHYRIKIENADQFIMTMNLTYIFEWFMAIVFVLYVIIKNIEQYRENKKKKEKLKNKNIHPEIESVPLLDSVVVQDSDSIN